MDEGDEMMPFSPSYVRKDVSILAHAFMAVMGMMLGRLTWKWVGRRESWTRSGTFWRRWTNWAWCW